MKKVGLWSKKILAGNNYFFNEKISKPQRGVVLKISVATDLVWKLKPVVIFPRFHTRFWFTDPLVNFATVRHYLEKSDPILTWRSPIQYSPGGKPIPVRESRVRIVSKTGGSSTIS